MTSADVSVIMPAWNAQDTIAESIESVLAQTYGKFQFIIVNDGSTDGTARVINRYAADSRLRVLTNQRPTGAAHARNVALDAAEGRFISFCDSDDLWHPQKLERQLRIMEQLGAALCATSYQRIDESGRPISGRISVPREVTFRQLLRRNLICCASVVYDTSKVGKVRMIDYRDAGDLPSYLRGAPLHEDYITWLEILRRDVGKVCGIDEVLTYYRVRRGSHSSNKAAAALARWYIYRRVVGLPHAVAARFFVEYAASALAARIRDRMRWLWS